MKNIFDILELRRHIFSYVYPNVVKKGMTVKIIKSKFHPFLTGKIEKIYNIKKCKDY